MGRKKSAYAQAGVDIDEMMLSLRSIRRMVKSTNTRGVLSDPGTFGGMFASPGRDHALVASTDSVGTKLKVAAMARRHDTVGQDIVNHCVNDILVQGARPLFFLDYLGIDRLEAGLFREIVKGLAKACRRNGCTLLGGETAELPGLYPKGEYDLVGTIVGTVPRRKVVTGRTIKPGDAIIGLASNGLHTNGYSLARKVVFERAGLEISSLMPGTRRTVADVLLAPHRSYLAPVMATMNVLKVHGMAHITGGGLLDNVPRVLPAGTSAAIDTTVWPVPPVFQFIAEEGRVAPREMFRVFNMGIGFVVILRERDAARAMRVLAHQSADPIRIGRITSGRREVKLEGLDLRGPTSTLRRAARRSGKQRA